MTAQYIYPDWPAPEAVTALCTTRQVATDALPAGFCPRLPPIKQVHGTVLVTAEQAAAATEPLAADAVLSRRAGLGCRIVTADCLPILLSNLAGTEVAAVHAGWRGLAAGVIENCVVGMESAATQLMAWIGPAISQPAYEVGAEVREALLAGPSGPGSAGLDACFLPRGDKFLADLPALARLRLQGLGVEQVFGGDLCTWSDPASFHSFRRDGAAAGRIASMIWFDQVG
ncbi:MAG: peptidoglycan editing factor PgeF [Halieaceae bacterium]